MSFEVPVDDEQLAGVPQIGEQVIVADPDGDDPNDKWLHSFIGTIKSMDDDGVVTYTIEDQDGEEWEMMAHKFELVED